MEDIDSDILNYIEEEEKSLKKETFHHQQQQKNQIHNNKQEAQAIDKDKDQEKEKEIEISENDMKDFYLKLFPYELYFKWLGNNDPSYFEKREFSITKRGDIYIRFLSYRDDKDLKNDILKANPIKIDVGAVYNTLPKYRSSSGQNFHPIEKELVFDIDMTDYDDIRTCCSKANICNKCWKFMIIAYRILNEALREDFGFEKILWVFSGRRGIHCWVFDDKARRLTNEGRSAIANYLSWKRINKQVGISQLIKQPIHPSYMRAIRIIEKDYMEYIVKGQDIFNKNNQKTIELVMMYIKAYFNKKKDYNKIEENIKNIINSSKATSEDKWKSLVEILTFEDSTTKDLCVYDIQMGMMYPRLDINVSKHINHLLKSPFCVHPKTSLISVPLDEKSIINFDFSKIPSLKECLNDYNRNVKGKFHEYIEIFKEVLK